VLTQPGAAAAVQAAQPLTEPDAELLVFDYISNSGFNFLMII
jgi:hypothetical protein